MRTSIRKVSSSASQKGLPWTCKVRSLGRFRNGSSSLTASSWHFDTSKLLISGKSCQGPCSSLNLFPPKESSSNAGRSARPLMSSRSLEETSSFFSNGMLPTPPKLVILFERCSDRSITSSCSCPGKSWHEAISFLAKLTVLRNFIGKGGKADKTLPLRLSWTKYGNGSPSSTSQPFRLEMELSARLSLTIDLSPTSGAMSLIEFCEKSMLRKCW
mmetsp:Transcript_42764/g.98996  ORF Transcript_42764/g.98996 Transcript_42764/m.98996 type:complete len:215 (-) Transcript_42764:225-869(-)